MRTIDEMNLLLRVRVELPENFNAVQVVRIHLMQYPWFFPVRVGVRQYRILRGEVLPVPNNAGWLSIAPRRWRVPRRSGLLYPHPGRAKPMLKEMLVLSENTHERSQ
jgi:hypothetical protein